MRSPWSQQNLYHHSARLERAQCMTVPVKLKLEERPSAMWRKRQANTAKHLLATAWVAHWHRVGEIQ